VPEGSSYVYDPDRPPGTHFVREATDLAGVADGSYEVILSSHTLEHVANPLRALAEWARVTGPAGHVLLVVPHLEHTVDRRRPVTTLEHLEADLECGIGEDDATHVEEFVELADLDVDPERLTREELRTRTRAFASNRAIHHHVFDTELVVRLLDRAGYEILAVDTALPFHVVVLARVTRGSAAANDAFLGPEAPWRRRSVFSRDRTRASRPTGSPSGRPACR
jgi:SAM-dependent methyltransferase